jgi:enhancer of polycomb-like protein
VTQIFIPTPNTVELSASHYEALYPKRFSQPASYIRFSSTVEDCSGTAYCMSAEDEKFLEKMNATKRPGGGQPCKIEDFEKIMDAFENIAQEKQPYMAMDVEKILSYEELASGFDGSLSNDLIKFAALIYSHWREQRISREGRPIIPILKVCSAVRCLYRTNARIPV